VLEVLVMIVGENVVDVVVVTTVVVEWYVVAR
jgi:hypothetical protein